MADPPDEGDFETFLAELRQLPNPCPHRELLALLRGYMGARLYVKHASFKAERIEFARRQLCAGADRADAQLRVRDRYQVSEATARRIVAHALSLRRR